MLEASEADLELDVDRGVWQVRGDPATSTSWAQVAAHVGEAGLAADVNYTEGQPTFPFGTHLAVTEVDTETGKARLIRHVTVDDAGTVLSPVLAEGQRHGGIAQGVAQALLEEMVYDADGNPVTGTLVDYAIITATELPSFELLASETPATVNPLGAKGIGEAGHDRRHARDAELRHRRGQPPRHPPYRHATHAGQGLGRDQRSEGEPVKVTVTVNGGEVAAEVADRTLLVHFLRDVAGLTATNVGCDTSSCGACTVLLDGRSVKSCTVLAAQADGRQVTTVEGPEQRLGRAAPGAAGVPRRARAAVRVLHAGHGDGQRVAAGREPLADRGRGPVRPRGEPVPVHRLPQHRQGGSSRSQREAAQLIPAPFTYQRASSVDEALELAAQAGEDAKFLAGGHSLMPLMKLRLAVPETLIDIGRLGELSYIRADDGHIAVGALTTHDDIARSAAAGRRAAAARPCGEPDRRPAGAALRHDRRIARPLRSRPLTCPR